MVAGGGGGAHTAGVRAAAAACGSAWCAHTHRTDSACGQPSLLLARSRARTSHSISPIDISTYVSSLSLDPFDATRATACMRRSMDALWRAAGRLGALLAPCSLVSLSNARSRQPVCSSSYTSLLHAACMASSCRPASGHRSVRSIDREVCCSAS